MKKLTFIFLLTLVFVMVGCAEKVQDPYASFRNKTSTVIFNGGEKALANHDYSQAAQHFEALDAIYPFGPYAQQGQLDIIYAYYRAGDEASASVAADRYIRLYPRGPRVDYAYYMKGIVGFTQGLSWLQKLTGTDPAPRDVSTMQQSFSSFATVAQLFPDSPYAEDSLVRMAYIRNLMANREVLIAGFYLRRKAYVAAANRASYVVQHFEGSPQTIQALAIMVQSYRSLGLDKMANDTYKILRTNYPNAPELAKLARA